MRRLLISEDFESGGGRLLVALLVFGARALAIAASVGALASCVFAVWALLYVDGWNTFADWMLVLFWALLAWGLVALARQLWWWMNRTEAEAVIGSGLKIVCSREELAQKLAVVGRGVSTRTAPLRMIVGLELDVVTGSNRPATRNAGVTVRVYADDFRQTSERNAVWRERADQRDPVGAVGHVPP